MDTSLGWIIFLYSFSLFITLYLFIYTALRWQSSPGAGQFALIVLCEAAWIFGNICELLAPTLAQKLFWDNVQWPASLLVGPGVAWFALAFARFRPALVKRLMTAAFLLWIGFGILQMIPLLAAGGRPGAQMEIRAGVQSLTYPFLVTDYPGIIYQYALILAAMVYLIRWSSRQPMLYRSQSMIILTGFSIPIVGSLWGMFNTSVGPQRDLSPIMFAIGNLIVAWGLFRLQLFNVTQAARQKAVEHMRDPLVVLDADDRISDLNTAAQALFQVKTASVLGKYASDVLPGAIRLERWPAGREAQDEIVLEVASSTAPVGENELEQRTYELAVLPLTDRLGRRSGRILVLHDITVRKRNAEIQRLIDQERVLRHSEEKFHTTIEQIGEGFILIDKEGRVVEWNFAMTQITGVAREAALGQLYWDIMGQITVPERRTTERIEYYRQVVLSTLRSGILSPSGKPGSNAQIMALTGERKYIQQGAFPVRIGSENWIASLTRDISSEKQAQLSLERFAARMEILHDIDQSILAANSITDLCEKALNQMRLLIPYRQAGLGMVHPRGPFHTWLVQHGSESEPDATPSRLAGWVDYFLAHPELNTLVDEAHNLRVASLRCQEQLIGVIYLRMDENEPFSAEMEEILQDLAAQLAVALQHAELLEYTQRRVVELTKLHEMAVNLNSYTHSPQSLGQLAEKIAGLTGASRAAVLLYDDSSHTVRVAPPAFGFSEAEAARLNGPVPAGVHDFQAWTEEWIHLSSPDHPMRVVLDKYLDFQNLLAAPMLFEGNFFGGILLANKPGDFNPEDIHLLNVVCSQAAAVVLNMRLYEQLSAGYDATIAGWSKALELRDKETLGHSERVTELSLALAAKFGLRGEDLHHFKRSVLLHDIGKMGVPDAILLKEGPLTDAEWAIMRQHPKYAADLISTIDYLRPALAVAYSHHERWNGTGYPRGLVGEDIPFWARMFAVVDVWDALTNDRPYRRAWSHDDAIDYLRKEAGVLFDPRVVEVFITLLSSWRSKK